MIPTRLVDINFIDGFELDDTIRWWTRPFRRTATVIAHDTFNIDANRVSEASVSSTGEGTFDLPPGPLPCRLQLEP